MNNRNQKVTLEDISRRRMEVLENIRNQNNVLSEAVQELFSPIIPSHNQGKSSVMTKINTGMNIFEGIVTGIKLFNRIRKMFQKQ